MKQLRYLPKDSIRSLVKRLYLFNLLLVGFLLFWRDLMACFSDLVRSGGPFLCSILTLSFSIIKEFELEAGYRFDNLEPGEGNTDDVFVVLAFSGGGTRAASLAYGVRAFRTGGRGIFEADRDERGVPKRNAFGKEFKRINTALNAYSPVFKTAQNVAVYHAAPFPAGCKSAPRARASQSSTKAERTWSSGRPQYCMPSSIVALFLSACMSQTKLVVTVTNPQPASQRRRASNSSLPSVWELST